MIDQWAANVAVVIAWIGGFVVGFMSGRDKQKSKQGEGQCEPS